MSAEYWREAFREAYREHIKLRAELDVLIYKHRHDGIIPVEEIKTLIHKSEEENR